RLRHLRVHSRDAERRGSRRGAVLHHQAVHAGTLQGSTDYRPGVIDMTANALPASLAIRNLLEDLLGRDVTVNAADPPVVADLKRTVSAVYVDAATRMVAVIGLDLALAAYAGAAGGEGGGPPARGRGLDRGGGRRRQAPGRRGARPGMLARRESPARHDPGGAGHAAPPGPPRHGHDPPAARPLAPPPRSCRRH